VARALASGISQGTELLLYGGEGPEPFDPSFDPPNVPTYPRRYGYAWVGQITDVGDGSPRQAGERVFALRPHGDWHVLPDQDARVLPTAIPVGRAVLAANLETAVTAVWDSGVGLGDRVVVLGGGIVGLLCATLCCQAGAVEVVVIDPAVRRREAALALGATEARGTGQPPEGTADVVIEATGHPEALNDAVAHAGREAVVLVASFYGTRSCSVKLGARFHRFRQKLRASQVSSLPLSHSARWDFARRFALVVRCLSDPRLDALLEPAAPIERAAEIYTRLLREPGATLQSWFDYQ